MALRSEDVDLLRRLKGDKIYKAILRHSSAWELSYQKSESESFDEIVSKIGDRGMQMPARRKAMVRSLMAIAVSLLLLMVCYQWMYHKRFSTGLAETKTIWLPDSSKLVLDADSELSYSRWDWQRGNRRLDLSGRAYFEVKKGTRFEVNSPSGSVSVPGTSFNVIDRDKNYIVECFTGKVEVRSNDTSVLLTEGLQTQLSAGEPQLAAPRAFNAQKAKEWLDGVFNFYATPVLEVLDELERQYNVEVELEVDPDKTYTGAFDVHSLDRALSNICRPLGWRYVKVHNTIRIMN